MTCTDFRESLSARLDGEPETLGASELHRHLAGCEACRAFEADALRLRVAAHRSVVAAPDLTTRILGEPRPRPSLRERRDRDVLRLGLVMVSIGELLASAFLFVKQQGYGGEDHAGHESLSFTIAVCVGLLYVARRPRAAAAYLPILGVTVTLLMVTATLDVRAGHAALLEELPHVNLLAALVILWLLSRGDRPAASAARSHGRSPVSPVRLRRFRVVVRSSASRSIRGLGRAGLAVVVCGLVVVVGADPASAHAVLESSDPAPNSVLSTSPTTVTLTFDEPVTTLPTSLRVFGPDGERVDDGVLRHPHGSGQEVTVGIRDAHVHGTYLISWRVISADSHPVSGAFTFSVGNTSSAPKAPDQSTDHTVAVVLGASRFLGYTGCALFVGGVTFLAVCWPGGRSVRAAGRVHLTGAVLSLVAAGAALLLKGPYDAALGPGALGHGELLRETLSTTYGRGMLARALVAAAALASLVLGSRGRWALVVPALCAVGLVATFPVTGHAVAGDQRGLALPADLVHVAAMSVWLGGLVMVAVVLRRAAPGDVLPVVSRFSRLALVCVAALVATGSYQAWREVRVWGALTGTTYGRELLVKIGLVAVTVVAAWFSRAWITRLCTGDARASPTGSGIRRSVVAELVVACAVLGVTSALVSTQPASAAYHPTVAASLRLGPDTVQVSAVPDGDRAVKVNFSVFDKKLQPTDPLDISAEVRLPHHDIGPLPLELYHVDAGHDVATVSVPVAGDWILTVRIRLTEFDEFSKDLALPIR